VPPLPSPPGVWLDDGAISPDWAAPTSTDPSGATAVGPRRTLPPAAVHLTLLVALALVASLVWGLGGFARRTDVLRDTPVGTSISTGPYELRFTGATAQQRTGFDGTVTWRVTMTGEGRTTGDESIAPDYLGDFGMFVAKDDASGEVQIPQSQTFGPRQRIGGAFTPGLPLQPYAVQFDFSAAYRPQDTVTFVVYELELRDSSLLGNQDEEWRNATAAHRFRLPLEVLPTAVS
jgi:hypothetical protein